MTHRVAAGLLLALATTACFYGEPRVYTDTARLVPDVVGEELDDARVALEEEGLIVEVETGDRTPADGTSCPEAEVLEQDVAPGEQTRAGTIVTLTVARC